LELIWRPLRIALLERPAYLDDERPMRLEYPTNLGNELHEPVVVPLLTLVPVLLLVL
jgi:hypothetical protein